MADGLTTIGCLLGAMFVVPQLMSIMPDFDPLMIIVGIFLVLAGVQHMGFANVEASNVPGSRAHAEQRGYGDTARNARSSSDSGSRGQSSKNQEVTTEDLLLDAERCLEQNSWGAVQDRASKVLDKDPECARAWELLATAQKWDGKREEAAATVKKARDLYEVESPGLKALAAELSKSSGPNIEELEKKGQDLIAKRRYDLAIECFAKAIDGVGEDVSEDDKPRQIRLLRGRAECAQQLHDWSVCRRDTTALLEFDPNDTLALLQRAASNEALEKFSAALDDARKLLSLDPKSTAANRIVSNCRQALR